MGMLDRGGETPTVKCDSPAIPEHRRLAEAVTWNRPDIDTAHLVRCLG